MAVKEKVDWRVSVNHNQMLHCPRCRDVTEQQEYKTNHYRCTACKTEHHVKAHPSDADLGGPKRKFWKPKTGGIKRTAL